MLIQYPEAQITFSQGDIVLVFLFYIILSCSTTFIVDAFSYTLMPINPFSDIIEQPFRIDDAQQEDYTAHDIVIPEETAQQCATAKTDEHNASSSDSNNDELNSYEQDTTPVSRAYWSPLP